jgi:hypothetical protein
MTLLPIGVPRFDAAFRLLGARASNPLDLVLAGGSALLLGGHFARVMEDIDVVVCNSSFDDTLRTVIATVGRELGMAGTWLNDGAAAFAHFLAPDYRVRCTPYGTFGQLSVALLGRAAVDLRRVQRARLYLEGAGVRPSERRPSDVVPPRRHAPNE